MRSCGWHNVRKHREIKNSEHYIALEIYFKLNFMVKGEVKSSGSRDYVGIYGKWLTTPTTIRTKSPTNKQKGRTTINDITNKDFRNLLKKFNNLPHLCYKNKQVHNELAEA